MGDRRRRRTGILHYRVELLEEPELGPAGIHHAVDGSRSLLAWDGIRTAMAAEVGEPEGVRAIVFDLIASEPSGWVAFRLAAEPGEEAVEIARRIAEGLGPDRPSASLKSMAADGIPTRWYANLDDLEEDAIHLLQSGD